MEALYYPTFELPTKPSLNAVLLYWDQVVSIVPERRTDGLSPKMQDLIDSGLATTIDPEPYVDVVDEFTSYFLERVAATPPEVLTSDHEIWVDVSKASYRLWQGLRRLGLAREIHGGWFELPSTVALAYMSYLAVLISRMYGNGMQPLTDATEVWNPLGTTFATGQDRDRIRAVILRNLLPYPDEGVAVRQLAEFKSKYWDELETFRNRIEIEVDWCAAQPSHDLAMLAANRSNVELRERGRELRARMRERRWRIAAAAVGAAILATPPVTQAVTTWDPLAMAAAASVPIAEAVRYIVERRGSSWVDGSPFAYAALANRAFSRHARAPAPSGTSIRIG